MASISDGSDVRRLSTASDFGRRPVLARQLVLDAGQQVVLPEPTRPATTRPPSAPPQPPAPAGADARSRSCRRGGSASARKCVTSASISLPPAALDARAHRRGDDGPGRAFPQQRVDEGAVLAQLASGWPSWSAIASLAASGAANAPFPERLRERLHGTVPAAATAATATARRPVTAARGSPSWSASSTTLSRRSSARLFWYLR